MLLWPRRGAFGLYANRVRMLWRYLFGEHKVHGFSIVGREERDFRRLPVAVGGLQRPGVLPRAG
jgi:hypothetical protein